jgi:hypothetical protein
MAGGLTTVLVRGPMAHMLWLEHNELLFECVARQPPRMAAWPYTAAVSDSSGAPLHCSWLNWRVSHYSLTCSHLRPALDLIRACTVTIVSTRLSGVLCLPCQ